MCLQGASDTPGLGGEGSSGASDAAGASYLDAFAAFRDEVSNLVNMFLMHYQPLRLSSSQIMESVAGCPLSASGPVNVGAALRRSTFLFPFLILTACAVPCCVL